jgi:flagellar motility protein MotE (MotC chaperone)
MKNLLVIALVSIVLFGVAAGLTVWLQTNQTKTTDTAHGDDKKKKSADDHGDGKPTEKGHDDPHKDETKPSDPKAAAKDADRVEYRRLQMEVAAADLSGQMQDYDKVVKRAAAEMKVLFAQQDQIDAKLTEVKQVEDRTAKTAADIKKGQSQGDDTAKANLIRIAGLLEQMPPESAAGIVQQWTDSGKTDTAVKVIALMKPTKAVKVLGALTDPTASQAVFDRMEALNLTPPGAGKPAP